MVTSTVTAGVEKPRDLFAVYDVARHLCQKALADFHAGKRRPKDGLTTEYQIFDEADKKARIYLSVGDTHSAARLMWSVATKQVLNNPKVMAFYIRGAYEIHQKLLHESHWKLEQQENWTKFLLLVATLEQYFWEMLCEEGEPNAAKLLAIVEREDFESYLGEFFSYQVSLAIVPGQPRIIIAARKNIIYAAMCLYSHCRMMLKKHDQDAAKTSIEQIRHTAAPQSKQPMTKRGRRRKQAREAAANRN